MIPANGMSVTEDIFNPGTDNFFEMAEDLTISVSATNSNGYFVVGDTITISIMDDGESPGEDPHILYRGRGPIPPPDRPSTVDFG